MKSVSLAFISALFLGACYFDSGGVDTVPQDDVVTLTMYNYSDYVMYTFYATPCNATSWGPNLLHGHAIFPDERFSVRLEQGCWDFLAEGGANGYDVFWDRYGVYMLSDQTWVWSPIPGAY